MSISLMEIRENGADSPHPWTRAPSASGRFRHRPSVDSACPRRSHAADDRGTADVCARRPRDAGCAARCRLQPAARPAPPRWLPHRGPCSWPVLAGRERGIVCRGGRVAHTHAQDGPGRGVSPTADCRETTAHRPSRRRGHAGRGYRSAIGSGRRGQMDPRWGPDCGGPRARGRSGPDRSARRNSSALHDHKACCRLCPLVKGEPSVSTSRPPGQGISPRSLCRPQSRARPRRGLCWHGRALRWQVGHRLHNHMHQARPQADARLGDRRSVLRPSQSRRVREESGSGTVCGAIRSLAALRFGREVIRAYRRRRAAGAQDRS